jgi:peptide/nickel transport system substrate-binding protein
MEWTRRSSRSMLRLEAHRMTGGMTMKRRHFLAATAAAASGLAAPALAQPTAARVLRFVPHANLTVMDPIWTTAYVTRNHGFMVWDTLYGLDKQYRPQPQMAEGHTVENDGRTWVFTLREGLVFHDGEPVRSADVIASLKRWAARDAFGAKLASVVTEYVVRSDRVFEIRLSKPFPLMLDALAKPTSNVPFIMPERVAATDPFTQLRPEQMIGSGPFRFKRDEFNPGSLVVYERNPAYRPRAGGEPSFTAGPKVVHFDRIEWRVIADPATVAAALQAGEIDWWEQPTGDYLRLLERNRNITVEVQDQLGLVATLRPNHLHAPMNNQKFRQALIRAVRQSDYMQAVIGTDPRLHRKGVGAFTPGTPLATDTGIAEVFKEDIALARQMIRDSGYSNERVVLLSTTDLPSLAALSQVGGAMFRELGVNLDQQAMDWGTVVQRRASKEPLERGGWSVFFTFWAGLDHLNPASHHMLRGQGEAGFIGWPTSPRLEQLRDAWFEAPTLEAQKAIAAEMQRQLFIDVPYIPLGQYFQPIAYRRTLTGAIAAGGVPVFWNVRRAA